MMQNKKSVKYRIKSYYSEESDGRCRMLFTLEEIGYRGECRQYAGEIAAHAEWESLFSVADVTKIKFALDNEVL